MAWALQHILAPVLARIPGTEYHSAVWALRNSHCLLNTNIDLQLVTSSRNET